MAFAADAGEASFDFEPAASVTGQVTVRYALDSPPD